MGEKALKQTTVPSPKYTTPVNEYKIMPDIREETKIKKEKSLYGLANSLIFSVNVQNFFRCCYCGKVNPDALQAKCGHIYCADCLDKIVTTNKRCPLDSELIIKEEVQKNAEVEAQIKQLPAYCPYQVNGCKEILPLNNISKHIHLCKFATIKCPQGCKEPIKTSELQDHLRFTCTFRHIPCKYCDKMLVLAYQQEHFEECLRILVECPNQCGQIDKIPREEIPEHLQTCNTKLYPCQYQHLGCTYQSNRNALKAHEEDIAQHFKIMADGYSYLNLQFDILMQGTKGNILLLQNDNCALRESIKELMKQFERLEGLNENITEKLTNLRSHIHKILLTQEALTEKECHILNSEQNGTEMQDVKNQLSTFSHEMMETMQEDIMAKIHDQDQRLQALEMNNFTGVLIWKITDYAKRKDESISRTRTFLFSDPFFTDRYGYQLCAKAFLGGEGDARGTHLSLYVIVMRGPWDEILPWPFRHKFTISLLDQRNVLRKSNLTEHFSPNTTSSFDKPATIMNVGAGVTKFVPHAVIEQNDTYLCNDTIYLKIAVSQDHHKSKR